MGLESLPPSFYNTIIYADQFAGSVQATLTPGASENDGPLRPVLDFIFEHWYITAPASVAVFALALHVINNHLSKLDAERQQTSPKHYHNYEKTDDSNSRVTIDTDDYDIQ